MTSLHQPYHPLDAWITEQGKTREWAAARLQTTKASLSRIINGKQWPGPEFFERIEVLTGGQVTAEHFLDPNKPVNRRGPRSKPPGNTVPKPAERETVRVRLLIDRALAAEAADLGIDLETFAQEALREGIRRERVKRWQAEHADVIAWYNDHVEKDGIFGEEWRTF